ncbi:MAG: glycine cleavage T C-terminal barrel domain-containing protein [Actinomycetota bacterium]
MVHERPEMLEKSATLYFGPWYRKSPYFEATRKAGCTSYDIYNHMYLPGYYDDPETEYWALINDVTLWDVAVERTIEVSGPDADKLINMLTCRDLTKTQVHQGKYMIVTAPDGGIVNDPVLLHPKENLWYMQLADSDAGLYALGVASQSGLDVDVKMPDVYPCQVQGAKAAQTLEKLVGPGIYDIKYYWTQYFDIKGIPVLISRTGWTAVQGFEVNIIGYDEGENLWNAILEAGEEFNIRPIAPCEGRRIEAGIFNYGSDMTLANNPFELMGMERLVEDQEADYNGKAALEQIKKTGVKRKLVGIEVEGDELRAELSEYWPVHSSGKEVGYMTDAVWSPRLRKNIGYVWVPIELADPGNQLDIESEHGALKGQTAAIPFLDPKKEVPASDLKQEASA